MMIGFPFVNYVCFKGCPTSFLYKHKPCSSDFYMVGLYQQDHIANFNKHGFLKVLEYNSAASEALIKTLDKTHMQGILKNFIIICNCYNNSNKLWECQITKEIIHSSVLVKYKLHLLIGQSYSEIMLRNKRWFFPPFFYTQRHQN